MHQGIQEQDDSSAYAGWRQGRSHIYNAVAPHPKCSGNSTAITMELAVKQKRHKQWHSKSRDGCLTCKKRHLRCDQVKPACLRCRGTGRVCDGYAPTRTWLFEAGKTSTAVLIAPSSYSDASEARSVQFFHENTKQALRFFNSAAHYFFAYVVPQVAGNEPAIKHQMIAAASAHELISCLPDRSNMLEIRTAEHYGSALSIISKSSLDISITLISCLLFVAIESLRGVPDHLYYHLQSGLRILEEWKARYGSDGKYSSTDALIRTYVEPIFAQLESTAARSQHSKVAVSGLLTFAAPVIPKVFTTLFETRETLSQICHWLFLKTRKLPNATRAPRHPEVEELYRQWAESLARLKLRNLGRWSQRELLRIQFLDFYHHKILITLECQSMTTETYWDQHMEHMAEDLALCQVVVQNPMIYDSAVLHPLQIDFEKSPGVVAAASQIAVACRDPQLRRQAVEVIRRHHHQCGHNDNCAIAVMVDLIIELEEQGLGSVRTCRDVPEENRIRPLIADFTTPGQFSLTYARSPYTVQQQVTRAFESETATFARPFKLWPMGATMRLTGYQGLIRTRSRGCVCRSFGATWTDKVKD